ncbi:hypothetical protein [Mesorhizobium sp. M0684]|uniref:hypothetical protein n=1 Tax=Mesorhizobium sp. M0684 TaxID=2956986 RepID=UPI0033393560
MALNIARTSEHDAPNDERLPTIGLAQDITLTSQDGARVSLRDFRGEQRGRVAAVTGLQILVVSGGLLFRGSSRIHQRQPHGNKCRKRYVVCSLECPLLGYGFGLLNGRHQAQT